MERRNAPQTCIFMVICRNVFWIMVQFSHSGAFHLRDTMECWEITTQTTLTLVCIALNKLFNIVIVLGLALNKIASSLKLL